MWKYQSNGSDISLHDKVIDKILVDGRNAKFIFEDGFDVHFPNSNIVKITTQSQLHLENFSFMNCELSPITTLQQPFYEEVKTVEPLLKFKGIEVLNLDFQHSTNQYLLKGNTVFNYKKDGEAFLVMAFSCEKMVYCWNDYSAQYTLE